MRDLTTIIEKVARRHYESSTHEGFDTGYVSWDDLDVRIKTDLKSMSLPHVMATLHAIDDEPDPVFIVTDTEGERLEVYLTGTDAYERVAEINATQGEGFAFADQHEVLAPGKRPANPHHGI